MNITVYRAKRDPLKRISLEKPLTYSVLGNLSTPCDEARQPIHVTNVAFKKHIYDCSECIPACIGTVETGSCKQPPVFPCKSEETKKTIECIKYSLGSGAVLI